MGRLCVLVATGIVIASPLLAPRQVRAQSADNLSFTDPANQVRVTSVTVTSVRPLEIDGTHTSPIPEPSAGMAVGLLATAFLVRRRRPRLD
jgi:hypothetical protein